MDESIQILVVDDDPAVRVAIGRMLARAGYAVTDADTLWEGLSQARTRHFDLILCDVMLPDGSGLDLCRELKAPDVGSDAFVVLCSAQRVDAASVEAGLAAGADGYLARPLEGGDLVVRVQGFLRHRRALLALRASDRRYRSQFIYSPLPTWIVDRATHRVLAANPAAEALVGLVAGAVLPASTIDLFATPQDERAWLETVDSVGGTAGTGRSRHRGPDGMPIEVDLVWYPLEWDGREAMALVVTDLTEHLALAAEWAERRDAQVSELARIERLAADEPTPVTARAVGVGRLSEIAPETFSELEVIYAGILDRALHQRVYRTDDRVTPALFELAERLFLLLAGPRDVTELHYRVLRARTASEPAARVRGLLEAARLLALELMGHLLSAYRNRYMAFRGATGQGPRPPAGT